MPKNKSKISVVMREFKRGTLHSGSKKGPKVKNRRQALAIAMSEAGMSKKNPAPPYGSVGCFNARGKMGVLSD